jgi:hypothetical protein
VAGQKGLHKTLGYQKMAINPTILLGDGGCIQLAHLQPQEHEEEEEEPDFELDPVAKI